MPSRTYNKYASDMADHKNTVIVVLYQKQETCSTGPPHLQGGTFIDPLAKLNIFVNYFSSVFVTRFFKKPSFQAHNIELMIYQKWIADSIHNIIFHCVPCS